jgi:hypothetical protein
LELADNEGRTVAEVAADRDRDRAP